MNMTETLTVITANAQMGRLIREPGALGALAHADVLLLQEVQPDRDDFASALKRETDLRLDFSADDLHLAIALRRDYQSLSSKRVMLQEEGHLARALDSVGLYSARFRGRGLIRSSFRTPGQQVVSVATTHPTVPVKFLSRKRQVAAIPSAISSKKQPLILGGDMNHWPGPRKADRAMYEEAGLQAVDIGNQATYDFHGTRHAWLGKLGLPAGQPDALLYRGDLMVESVWVLPIASDHRAVAARFVLSAE